MSSSSSSAAAAAAAETKCEKNKNSIDNTDTDATATANTSTAIATATAATAASTTLTIDDEYDGCSSCARACGGEEKNDNNNKNNNDLTIARAMHVIESLTSLYGFSSDAANDAINNIALNGNNKDSNNNDSIDTILSLCCDYILDNGLGMDDGGAITPINNCPHVVQIISENEDDTDTNNMCCCVFITPNDIPNNIFELSCQYYRDNNSNNNDNDNDNEKEKQEEKSAIVGKFKNEIEYDDDTEGIATCPKGENWFCLYCGGIYCSRYVNGHGVKHYEDTNTNTNDDTTKSTDTNIDSHCCVMVGLADLSIWCHKCESYLETHNNTYLNSIINKLQQIKFD